MLSSCIWLRVTLWMRDLKNVLSLDLMESSMQHNLGQACPTCSPRASWGPGQLVMRPSEFLKKRNSKVSSYTAGACVQNVARACHDSRVGDWEGRSGRGGARGVAWLHCTIPVNRWTPSRPHKAAGVEIGSLCCLRLQLPVSMLGVGLRRTARAAPHAAQTKFSSSNLAQGRWKVGHPWSKAKQIC